MSVAFLPQVSSQVKQRQARESILQVIPELASVGYLFSLELGTFSLPLVICMLSNFELSPEHFQYIMRI